ERLFSQPRVVLGLKSPGEPLFLACCPRRPFPAPDDMAPERYLRTCDISPQDIQTLVPGVERGIIRAFKACAPELKDLNVVALCGSDDRIRNVSGVRDVRRDLKLATERRRAKRSAHAL